MIFSHRMRATEITGKLSLLILFVRSGLARASDTALQLTSHGHGRRAAAFTSQQAAP